MKKLFFVPIILVCLMNLLLAQELSKMNPTPLEPVNLKDWRLMLQVSGPSQWTGSFNAIKPISDKWFLRVGASPIISTSNSKNDNTNDEGNFYEQVSRRNAWGASLGLGAEYHFNTKGKLDPFIGMGSNFGFSFIKGKNESLSEYATPLFDGLIKAEELYKYNNPVGFKINPFGSFGVNYFISPRFAIGAEYGIGPNFSIENGTRQYASTITRTYSDGKVEIIKENNENDNNSSSSLGVDLQQRVGVHFIYVIDRKNK